MDWPALKCCFHFQLALLHNGKILARMSIRNADTGAKTHVWLSTADEARGRGLHSSTSQLNLSRF